MQTTGISNDIDAYVQLVPESVLSLNQINGDADRDRQELFYAFFTSIAFKALLVEPILAWVQIHVFLNYHVFPQAAVDRSDPGYVAYDAHLQTTLQCSFCYSSLVARISDPVVSCPYCHRLNTLKGYW